MQANLQLRTLAGFGPPLTVEEVEAAHLCCVATLGPDPVAFGYQNDRWLALLTQMQPGDELRAFRSSAASWKHLAGRAGIALVRSGKQVASIVTIMN